MRVPKCEINRENVRPEDYNYSDYNKGDCTTRAMAYCLKGIMTYNEIEAEQYRLAKIYGTRRNTTGTWDKVLTQFGYTWLQLPKVVVRSTIANILANTNEPLLSLSRTHVATIEKGVVIDTWDSTRGRCFGLLVSNTEIEKVMSILLTNGIETRKVEKPVYKSQPHKRRYNPWFW